MPRPTLEPADHSGPHPPPPRRLRPSSIAAGAAAGAAFTLLVALLLLWFNRPEGLPPLSAEALDAARRRWDQQGPDSYNLDLLISGRQTGRFHVEVRGGRPTFVTRNGRQPPRRTWDVWTVPGMFDIIDEEVDQAHDPAGGFSARGGQAVLRAHFHPRYGYPETYQRIILGASEEIEWKVTRFIPH
jgi:hypothetical protein